MVVLGPSGSIRIWFPEFEYRLSVDGVRAFVSGASGPDPDSAITGVGGLSVALAALCSPTSNMLGVGEVARWASMDPSTISRVMRQMQAAGLIDHDGVALDNELFWATRADRMDAGRAMHRRRVVERAFLVIVAGGTPATRTQSESIRPSSRATAGDEVEVCVEPTPVLVTTSDASLGHPVVAALDLSTTGHLGVKADTPRPHARSNANRRAEFRVAVSRESRRRCRP